MHYGKVMKQLVKQHSNFRLGQKKKKKGAAEAEYEKSYVQQGAEHRLYSKQLNREVSVKPSEYAIQKKHIQEWVWERKQEQRQRTAPRPKTTAKKKRTAKRQVAESHHAKLAWRSATQTQNKQWKPHHTPHSKLPKVEAKPQLP